MTKEKEKYSKHIINRLKNNCKYIRTIHSVIYTVCRIRMSVNLSWGQYPLEDMRRYAPIVTHKHFHLANWFHLSYVLWLSANS